MKVNFRNLNNQEQYACEIKDVKTLFRNEKDIFISFGFLGKSYRFDNAFIKRPNINGVVICSLQINRRLATIERNPILSFYVIRDEKYNINYKKEFSESILSKIYEWYQSALSKADTSIPGVETLLIEWTGAGFIIHSCRYS